MNIFLGNIDPPLNPPIHLARILQCKEPYALMSPAFGSPKCSYPGGDILEYVIQLHQLLQEYDAIVDDSRYAHWMNEYNVKFSFSNPYHIESVTTSLSKIKTELARIDVDISLALSEVYDIYTVNEWKDTFIKPFKQKVQNMWEARRNILARDVWPRRPLTLNEF